MGGCACGSQMLGRDLMKFTRKFIVTALLTGSAAGVMAIETITFSAMDNIVTRLPTTQTLVVPDVNLMNATVLFFPGVNGPLDGNGNLKYMEVPFVLTTAPSTVFERSVLSFGPSFQFNEFDFRYSANFAIGITGTYLDQAGTSSPFSLLTNVPSQTSWGYSSHIDLGVGKFINSIAFENINRSEGEGLHGARISELRIYNAVPEPSTYALMLLGVLAIGFATRRRMH